MYKNYRFSFNFYISLFLYIAYITSLYIVDYILWFIQT